MGQSFKDRKPPSDSEIREYFQILKGDPRSRVFAPLAEALIRRGRLDEAEQLCRIGLEAHPDFSDGHLAYCRVLFYRFRYQEALEEVKLTLALDGRNTDAYLIAAEIFLTRSQHKACSDTCLKVLDLEPEHPEAMRLLNRLGAEPAAPPEASAPDAGRFKASAGTAPSRRRLEPGESPSMTNPFQQLMQEMQDEAAQKLLDEEQPFTALSSGSQVDQPALAEVDFEIPTAPVERPRPADSPADVPRLPRRPPTPAPEPVPRPASPALDDLLAQAPQAPAAPEQRPPPDPPAGPASEPPGAGSVAAAAAPPAGRSPPGPTSSRWVRIDAAQAIIDAYRDRVEPNPHEPPLRVPRMRAMLPMLGMLALLAGVVALILVLLPSGIREPNRATRAPEAPAAAGSEVRDTPAPGTDDQAREAQPADPEPLPARTAAVGDQPAEAPPAAAAAAAVPEPERLEPPAKAKRRGVAKRGKRRRRARRHRR